MTVCCITRILEIFTISSFTQCDYVLTPAHTHNAYAPISLTNFWNKISRHNISQEEKYGQKMTTEINGWEELIIWIPKVGRNLVNKHTLEKFQVCQHKKKQIHFSMDIWRPEKTSWRRKNVMTLWNACVRMGIHTQYVTLSCRKTCLSVWTSINRQAANQVFADNMLPW
jgi:hypothetical protein